MKTIRLWFGYDWSTPVVSRRWAFATTVMQWVKRATGYRVGNRAFGRAWEHAVGTR